MSGSTGAMHLRTIVSLSLFFVGGCAAQAPIGGLHGQQSGTLPAVLAPASSKIQHFVILIQENRSFDNFFATFPGADGTTTGTMSGKTVKLTEGNLPGLDPWHDHGAFLIEYDHAKMDGFGNVGFDAGRSGPAGTYTYQYVNPAQIAPYWTMAKQYVLADHMFATQSSGSFTGHQDLITAGTQIRPGVSIVDFPNGIPWGCDASAGTTTSLIVKSGWVPGTDGNYAQYKNKGPFPCFTYPTLRDLLDAKHISWKYYVPPRSGKNAGDLASWDMYNAFDAIAAVRCATYEASKDLCSGNGAEWGTNVVWPEKKIFTDIQSGTLPDVSWVIPDYYNSDHPQDPPNPPLDYGPSWVASVVNAIGESKYWDSTAIVVIWDDWGGWYDHVAPPQLDYQGLGFRVPMLVISPYVPAGYVSHVQYEFGSILKCIEQTWHLPHLSLWDTRPNSICNGPGNVFDFARAPRKFVPIPAPHSKSFFLHQAESGLPVDTQ
jgi:phospholipase C